MSSPEEALAFWRMQDDYGIVTMNYGQRLNCLSREFVAAIIGCLAALEEKGARAVILRAQPGVKVWSAGHDIKEIPRDGQDPVAWNVPFEVLLRRVRKHPVPIIGLIEGSVWGGACDLAMTLDLLVGAPSASFAITPVKLGLPYNAAGLTHFLGVLPLHIVKEMLFTGQPLAAADAFRLGLLNRLAPAEELDGAAAGLARDIASRAPLAVQVLKKELRNLSRGPGLTAEDLEDITALRQEAYRSQDFQEGLTAFLEHRDPCFKGC
ncbi:MAG: methylmalonyl-CoA decarboxylase [Deltaproteobacteria bacterium]|nr:methylmalonyl-CoA decarboxylase [Deltaproteobacteria bacterium]